MSRRFSIVPGNPVWPVLIPSRLINTLCIRSYRTRPYRAPQGSTNHAVSETIATVRDDKESAKQTLAYDHEQARYKRPAGTDWISLALERIGRRKHADNRVSQKGNLSRHDDRVRLLGTCGEEEYDEKEDVLQAFGSTGMQTTESSTILRTREPTVRRILADCIVGLHARSFNVTLSDRKFLAQRRLSIGHVLGWAQVLVTRDTALAFSKFWRLYAKHGRRGAPVFLLLQLLRRRDVGARALRYAIRRAQYISKEERRKNSSTTISIFILFVRLLRHARVTWPSSISTVTGILISSLPSQILRDEAPVLTSMANSALHLISLPSGLETFANVVHRESGIVQVLEYMAVHELHLNRAGYRAVVRTQLTEPKSSQDRLWAELKALSWPPWKEDRTQMDSQITRETHGISRAMNTLMHMEAVGFAPYAWESAAKIYAGWDVDGTPTIQTRVLLGSRSTNSMVWTARIVATRTAQEAWASYLAWEDQKQGPSSAVYEAIFRKLHQESRRLRRSEDGRLQDREVMHMLAPGDLREISPPPPSTHLYTYTSTPPPTVDKLYRKLKDEGVKFNASCVAFLVTHAPTLERGIEYLHNEQKTIPAVIDFSSADFSRDLKTSDAASRKILTAYIELLCRFPRNPLYESPHLENGLGIRIAGHKVKNLTALAAALKLYMNWSDPSREAWRALVASLASPRAVNSLPLMFAWKDQGQDFGFRTADAAIKVLHELFRKRKNTSAEDELVFLVYACYAHASAIFEAWMSLAAVADLDAFTVAEHADALTYLSRRDHEHDLKSLFWSTIGNVAERDTFSTLAVPSPAVLHAYIRTIGWNGDYNALLEVLRWIAQHQKRIAHQAARVHNGVDLLRKCMVAVRVFMERSFLPPQERREGANSIEQALERLEQPAAPGLIEEARHVVQSLEAWDGDWPSDEEVQDYIGHAHTMRRLQRIQRMYDEECL